MAILPQPSLFSWQEIDALDDLHRLRLVLGALPDEALMRRLERDRGRGRRQDGSATAALADGTLWEKVQRWFGYKVHLVADAEYELPVAYKVMKASASEMPQARALLDGLAERHPAIDIRAMWKEPDETRVVPGTRNVVYDQQGTVYCHCPKTGCRRQMAYGGFENDRETLKYRCPAIHYKVDCAGRSRCGVRGSVRIAMALDRRLFTPLARSSYAWKRVYAKRCVKV